MGALEFGHRNRDLDTEDEVAEFVRRFYREIAQDERFHFYFEDVAHVDWYAHTGNLTDFWVGILLDGPTHDANEVIEAHRWLNDTEAFDEELFDRWIEILDGTLAGGWSGPLTDLARRRGRGYVAAMSRRFLGADRIVHQRVS